LVNMILDKTPPGKTSLDLDVYNEVKQIWVTVNTLQDRT
jgi:hypothetical protein